MKLFLHCLAFSCALFVSQLLFAENSFVISKDKLNVIAKDFEKSLGKLGAKGGAMCVVKSGQTIYGRDFASDEKKLIKYPLGNTSQALVSLMLVAMERDGIVGGDWKVLRHCSYIGDKFFATFSDLLSMRGGIDPRADSLLPRDASSEEVFSIAKQFPPIASAGELYEKSRMSAALAGYALGYLFNKSERNMKKSFVSCVEKYLFKPLNFSEPRFSSFDSSLFPATPFALSIIDISKWLECETSMSPKIAEASLIAKRRISSDSRMKFSNGWLTSSENGADFQVSADYWENCANVVAIFPEYRVAIIFIVNSKKAKEASKLCADSLSKFIKNLTLSKK